MSETSEARPGRGAGSSTQQIGQAGRGDDTPAAQFVAGLRRRRAAAWRCEPLACGRRDPHDPFRGRRPRLRTGREPFQITAEKRKGLVRRLDELKATQRATAKAIGVNQSTVARDLPSDANASSDAVPPLDWPARVGSA